MSHAQQRAVAASETVEVLHVDDDSAVRTLTTDMLEAECEPVAVSAVATAQEALERLADEPVDCIVSDYDMPGMDGIEFLEAVRDRYPTLPFILFTGKGSEQVASDAFSAGATDYVQKGGGTGPYTVLAQSIRNAVERERTRQTQQRHLEAIESAGEGIAVLNARSEFVYVNGRYAEMFGYDEADLLGEPWDVVHPDGQHADTKERARGAAREDGYWHGQTTGLRADGSTFPRELSVTATDADEFVCIARDLSEQRQREQALMRYETIIEAVPDPVYTLDSDGRFTFVNEAMTRKLGYTREELLGESASIAVTEESLGRATEAIAELLADDDTATTTVELEKTPADGSEFVAENHITTLPTPDGERAGTAGVVRDITERKAREEELARQQSLLAAQNERLDEFASMVSHDLQNPLQVAQTRLELASEDCDSPHHDAVGDALEKMDAIITDLLRLARRGSDVEQIETVEVGTLARDCWASFETGPATLSVADDRALRADPTLLQQLLTNLLQNAADHAGDEPTVTVGTLSDGFYVEDDGDGIPAAERERIFEAGYSGSDGTGFGLQIVQQVADAHGWEVRSTESAAGGARFEITGVDMPG